MARTLDDALADAEQRGALTSTHSADRWRDYARKHGQAAAAGWVDALESAGPPASGAVMAGRRVGSRSVTVPLAARPRMSDDTSLFAPNGLLAELSRDRPALVAAAKAEDPTPPALFGDEDLPPFTASGLDPRMLADLPWPLRRPVAQATTLSAAYALVEKYAGVPEMTKTDLELARSNADYVEAFRSWLTGSGRTPADLAGTPNASANGQAAYSIEQLHRELFAGAPDYSTTPARPTVNPPDARRLASKSPPTGFGRIDDGLGEPRSARVRTFLPRQSWPAPQPGNAKGGPLAAFRATRPSVAWSAEAVPAGLPWFPARTRWAWPSVRQPCPESR